MPKICYEPCPAHRCLRTWKAGLGAIHLRMGCGDDGSVTIPLAHATSEATDPLVRLGTNGTALTRINLAHVAGFEKALIADFAPGPNGETYVLAYKVLLEEIKSVEEGQIRSIRRKPDSQPTLLRFDSNGELILRNHLEDLQKNGGPYKLAVFDTGDALLLDTGPGNRGFDTMLFSPQGKLLKKGSLAGSALDESIDERAEARQVHYLPVTAISSHNRIFLVAGEEVPALAVISPRGDVLYSSRLRVPPGYEIVIPRIKGEHVYAELQPVPGSQIARPNRAYAEFDSHTGMLVARHAVPSFTYTVACSTPKGMTFFHSENGVSTLELMQESDEVQNSH